MTTFTSFSGMPYCDSNCAISQPFNEPVSSTSIALKITCAWFREKSSKLLFNATFSSLCVPRVTNLCRNQNSTPSVTSSAAYPPIKWTIGSVWKTGTQT